ncbi:MAG: hypothetical protein JWN45_2523 [Acidobacteriaceae bacterium]|nr:hypothetical protein [Acidobacteriaceae bacterium]
MQTLGISDSTPASESRVKTLFWPSIQNGTDVDYLGTQGFWVCAIVAGITFVVSAFTGHWISGAFVLVLYYLGGVGVREGSRYAAAVVFVFYMLDMFASRVGVLKVFIAAILLSNLRATWIASSWTPGSEEASLPPRMSDTWSDKFADQLPPRIWPKLRIFYYIYSVCFLVLVCVGLAMIWSRQGRLP